MEPTDPYTPPASAVRDTYAAPPLGDFKPLGSLAQSARNKEISRARSILIVIGVLTMAANGFLLYNLETEIQGAIQGANAGPAEIEEFRKQATLMGYLLYGGPALLGLLFVVFGLFVRKYPVPITITSLVLYIAAGIGFAILNPVSLASGIIFKVIIIVALARAIRAARSYDSETRKAGVSGDELLA